MKNMFIFVHIAKTAGTTMQHILQNTFKKDYLPLYSIRKDDFLNNIEVQSIASIHSTSNCISSHDIVCPILQPNTIKIKYIPFTFFRDPVERIFSEYFFHKGRIERGLIEKEAPFHDFKAWYEFMINYGYKISDGRWTFGKNMQLYYIDSNMNLEHAKDRLLNEFLFSGVTERFDESLIILKQKFKKFNIDLQIEYIEQNVTKNILDFSEEKKLVRKEYTQMVKDNNQEEYNLLDFVNKQLDEEIKNYNGNFEHDLSILKKNKNKKNISYYINKIKYRLCRV
jgi:hypothetical protein